MRIIPDFTFHEHCTSANCYKQTIEKYCKRIKKSISLRFEPDAREYTPVNLVENSEYKASFFQADADAIVFDATTNVEQNPEKKGIVLDSIQWVTGTLQGSFNQKQTTSQIFVDSIIGMIPIVGDVTAVRDIIAVTIGLSLEESKRKDEYLWMMLVLLLFALIPVIGGALKGVGRLLLKLCKEIKKIADFIAVLNRIGVGDAVSFFKTLDLTKYTNSLLDNWGKLLYRLDTVITAAKAKLGIFLLKSYFERLDKIRDGLAALKIEGGKMIPESVKELQLRLRAIQNQMYKGDWHEIPNTLKSSTCEIEARLVASAGKKWVAQGMKFPPAKKSDFIPEEGWPDLTEGQFVKKLPLPNRKFKIVYDKIESFSGPIRPVKLRPKAKIYRVIQPDSNPAGLWWSYELPKMGRHGVKILRCLKTGIKTVHILILHAL